MAQRDVTASPVVETPEDKNDDSTANELAELKASSAKLSAQLQEEREARIRLEATLTQPPAEATGPKVHTAEELANSVNAGTITQAQMDAVLAKQDRDALKREILAESGQNADVEKVNDKNRTLMAEYVEHRPDIKVPGSDARKRVEAEFQVLTGMGQPNNLATEVMAVRNVFGSPVPKKELTREATETHAETGGEGAGGGSLAAGKAPKIPAKLRSHYEGMIAKGQYTGWEDPKLVKELKYIPQAAA